MTPTGSVPLPYAGGTTGTPPPSLEIVGPSCRLEEVGFLRANHVERPSRPVGHEWVVGSVAATRDASRGVGGGRRMWEGFSLGG